MMFGNDMFIPNHVGEEMMGDVKVMMKDVGKMMDNIKRKGGGHLGHAGNGKVAKAMLKNWWLVIFFIVPNVKASSNLDLHPKNLVIYLILVVPMTFGHPWLHHSSHPERVVVPTDVVRVLEPSRVYPQVISSGIYSLTRHEKTQNPGSDILNLGS